MVKENTLKRTNGRVSGTAFDSNESEEILITSAEYFGAKGGALVFSENSDKTFDLSLVKDDSKVLLSKGLRIDLENFLR